MLKLPMKKSGWLLIAGVFALAACGGAEGPETTMPETEQLTPLHHNSPVYEEVDDQVPDTHDDAIDSVVDMAEDLESGQVMDGMDGDSDTSDMGSAATDTAM